MHDHTSKNNGFARAKTSSVTLIAESLQQLTLTPRTFRLSNNQDERYFIDELLRRPVPDLIIRIIGQNYDQARYVFQSSIDEAFRRVIRQIMEQTNIWLWNGSQAMVDLADYAGPPIDYNDEHVDVVMTEVTLETRVEAVDRALLRHLKSVVAVRILTHVVKQEAFDAVPIVNLFLKGDASAVDCILETTKRREPIIMIKGSGLLATQLAIFFESIINQPNEKTSKVLKLDSSSEINYHRLRQMNEQEQSLMFVCQPGRDELDSTILRAIGRRIKNSHRARIDEFWFAMQWKKFDYVQLNLLNPDTIIDWKNEELDTCLKMAIDCNAISFVELLFECGASLQRLAVAFSSDNLDSEIPYQTMRAVGTMITSLPTVTIVDPETRMREYVRHLFHRGVENQHFDLLMSICTRLEDSVIGILLIHQWCQYQENNDYTTAPLYRKHRQQFDIYAAEILDLYYADNEQTTLEWLNETSNLYEDQQAAALIDDLMPKQLIATQCIQAYANSRWYGDIFHHRKNMTWEILILVACLCPLLLFIPVFRNRIFDSNALRGIQDNDTHSSHRAIRKFELFRQFYQGNAYIRFRYSMIFYTAFLVLFSYTILFDYFPLNIYNESRSGIYRLPLPITEIILHTFLISIALEEMRQVCLHWKSIFIKSSYWRELSDSKLRTNTICSFYENDPWNVLDFIAFTLWIIGFTTRFIVRDVAFQISKICLSLDLCLWYMRCLHVFLASERLGARLLMIFHTMKDLILFLFFIFIFCCAYTFTTYSLISTTSFVIWSNATHFTTIQNGGNTSNFDIFRNLIEWGTWKIFGSTSLTTTDLVDIKYSAQNDAYGFVTLILTITFLIIAYVLLLNNLIALFNFTIQRVHTESHRAWCNHFYVILKEYEQKHFFVPPVNLFLWPIIFFMRRKLGEAKHCASFYGKTNEEKQRIRRRQQHIAEQYWKNKRRQESRSTIPRIFVCRQCQTRAIESDYVESTSL